MLPTLIQENIIASFATTILGALTFLIRHYFASIRKEIADGQKDVAKIAGHIEALASDIRANTIQLSVTSTEVKALWKYVDNVPRRASDTNGGRRD